MDRIYRRLQALRDKGCAILVVLLVTLPFWVISLAGRGRLFAFYGLLAFLVVVVFFALLHKYLDRRS